MHGAHGATGVINSINGSAKLKHRTFCLGHTLHCMRQLMHPAIDRPNALRLGMPDQAKNGGALVWGAANVSRVTPEELLQARIAEPHGQLPGEA